MVGLVPFKEIAIIKWKDAAYSDGTYLKGEHCKPVYLTTTGYLLEENDEYITICSEFDGNDQTTKHHYCILRINIVSVQKLRIIQKRRKKNDNAKLQDNSPNTVG